jgi:hypothetical protein
MTNAFVKALRTDPDEPDSINPIGWLHSAIEALKDPKRTKAERKEDPDAYWMMVREVEGLYHALKAALAEHDAANGGRPFYGAECPSYPACSGGCGLGCTHDVEARRA